MARLDFIALVLLVALACSGPQLVEGPGIEAALTNHFADAGGVEISPETRTSFTSRSNLLVGSGSLTGRNGATRAYKWGFVTDDDGQLENEFIGIVGSSSAAVPNLTEGETRDALRRCSERYPDARDMFDCFDRVADKVIRDCDNAFPDEAQCRIHCWYQGGECFP